MSVLLVSPKEKGNTFDVLKYVENNSDADMMIIGRDDDLSLADYETIIIGTGVYGGNLHKNLQRWLENIDKVSVNPKVKVYAFLTWFGRGKSDKATIKKIGTQLESKDLNLEDDYITCYGKMGAIRGAYPNADDRCRVLDWVKQKS